MEMTIINTMNIPRTMTTLLRQALKNASLYKTAEATGLTRQSLLRFRNGQQSLRLDLADKLAIHFGIESRFAEKKES